MSVTYHERPGVYVSYDVSSVSARASGRRTVALVASSTHAAGLYPIRSAEQALQEFGNTERLGILLQLLYQNGAQTVLVSPVTDTNYAVGLAKLDQQSFQLLVLDAADLATQRQAQQYILARADRGEYCIGIVGMETPETEELLERAQALNCERMVLMGPDVRLSGATQFGGGCLAAAALAGVLAAQTDPALPFNGAVLAGLDGVSDYWTDTDLDALILGGVTTLEAVGGQVEVIRAVTTRTTTADVADATYRELTTMTIIDDVISAIRATLATKFRRRKNTAVTRNAIRAQVVIELDERVRQEIIDSYCDLNVSANESDPTCCVVEFTFGVVHGLNRIFLTAHIEV